ncbi:MAG: DUF7230 family protein [Gammaproteobacteria bacterium]
MKKRINLNEIENNPRLNPVAKHAHRFNKTQVFNDRSQYRRKAKHPKQEAFPSISCECLEMPLATLSSRCANTVAG